ncbi:MAG: YitT family protein [Chitinophagaceae bacterium]
MIEQEVKMPSYRKAKRYREQKIVFRNFFRDLLLIALGIFSASFGLKGFLLPNQFIDGGATGI